MFLRATKYLFATALLVWTASPQPAAFAQLPKPRPDGPIEAGTDKPGIEAKAGTVDLDIQVKGPDGAPLAVMAVVTLTSKTGLISGQGTTQGGKIKFSGLAASAYTIHVVAPGFENAVEEFDGNNEGAAMVSIEMRATSNGENAGLGTTRRAVLVPKAQKELGKLLEALRSNKMTEARGHLNTAYRLAPRHPEVNYLFGVYLSQLNEREKAKSYWTRALEFDPRHVGALLCLGEALMREKKLPEAEWYVKRAVDADPSSWRARAILADVFLQQHYLEGAIQEAERAADLGHGQAASIQPLLARALAEGGKEQRAMQVLQEYLKEHPGDATAQEQLKSLQSPVVLMSPSEEAAMAKAKPSAATEIAIALPLPSSWLPPDIDERVPPVEPGATCALEEVVRNAGKRMQEFVGNVDRFTATENLVHKSINKSGLSLSPETRRFEYVVSIMETRPGFFNVEEYRSGHAGQNEFPDGVATNGLPTLALIFHPFNAKNFEMSCEGLGRSGGVLAWQVHFRQRADRPNTMRAYRLGANGPAYPVAMRGRAWIAVDSYQIVRLETDLVSPVPEIRLFADHTAIEYGPVHFQNKDVQMWLPQSAEVYYDWRGRRSHRRHSFSNYFLFSVDEKQRISQPKVEAENPQEK